MRAVLPRCIAKLGGRQCGLQWTFINFIFRMSDIVNSSTETVKRRNRKATIVPNQKRGGRCAHWLLRRPIMSVSFDASRPKWSPRLH